MRRRFDKPTNKTHAKCHEEVCGESGRTMRLTERDRVREREMGRGKESSARQSETQNICAQSHLTFLIIAPSGNQTAVETSS